MTDTTGSAERARLAELPDCMMPDGGDPCEGYTFLKQQFDASTAALRAENARLRTLLHQMAPTAYHNYMALRHPAPKDKA